jgi:hypothetical protein
MTSWYIDGWDARGGRAFASQREKIAPPHADDSNQLPICIGSPAIFIGPPGFQPEIITNPSVALAAARAGFFDPRLPPDTEKEEIGFPSAQAVAEFVRRAFMAGGGGRGGEGGTPAVEGGPGEPPASPEGENDDGLARYCRAFNSHMLNSPSEFNEFPPLLKETNSARRQDDNPILSGAIQTAATLLAAYPRDWADQSARLWSRAASALDAAMTVLDIWSDLLCDNTGTVLLPEPLNHWLSGEIKRFWLNHIGDSGYRPEYNCEILYVLLTERPLRHRHDNPDLLRQLQYRLEDYSLGFPYWAERRSGFAGNYRDRFELLFSWPLPHYAKSGHAAQNVGQLLVKFVSSPGQFAAVHPAVLAIVQFAAALLGTGAADRNAPAWRMHAANCWFAQSLPRWVFSAPLEEIIRQQSG